ncbi:hypothetical protein EYF80_029312 [Liparis tanakae]|uniref:Uncharacterized protein n=1 Tax=Liparis tanakae TaxID=230148 RepID=A0A4Z2H4B4_9TELE|nr:hypothetical protein EYF80_029312 [Liparis tanakae]
MSTASSRGGTKFSPTWTAEPQDNALTIWGSLERLTQPEISFSVSLFTVRMLRIRGCFVTISPETPGSQSENRMSTFCGAEDKERVHLQRHEGYGDPRGTGPLGDRQRDGQGLYRTEGQTSGGPTCCGCRSQMMVLMLLRISSMKGITSPTWTWTKCRRHFWAILMKVSHAMSCTPSCVSGPRRTTERSVNIGTTRRRNF